MELIKMPPQVELTGILLGFVALAAGYQLPNNGAGRLMRAHTPVACDVVASQPQIVSFSTRAMEQLESLKESQKMDVLFLRMGVRAGGCSGMSYVMDVAKPEDLSEDDTVIDIAENMRCCIDPKSLMFLYGMSLDYSDELIGGGFSFSNPNAEDTCGCGKSFGV
uniref:Core domain-containing protein n=1 Tax=Haptolina brevifila TaxID=156173 RepID=A0A7S2CTP2_9EUKA